MSSPALHLRAPLLWLLLPLMTGMGFAKFLPPPAGNGLLMLAGLAGAASLAAIWLGGRPGRPAGVAWGLALATSGGLAGFVLLHGREPHLHDWEDRPPREITATIRISQIFPSAPQSRSIAGLGEIVMAGKNDRALTGRRVYFSAIRKVSVPPRRSGCYLMRGVIEGLSPEVASSGFDDYLESLAIHHKFSRVRILNEEISPGRFQRFCSGTEDRLVQILHRGLQNHPAVDSLYLAMLLGEKAVLSVDQQNAFMRSGTFHIFSISGLHVGIIALAVQNVLGLLRLPRRPAVVLSLAVLWLYVQVTGGGSPALRSLLMIAFLLARQVLRLPGNGLAALCAAALATLLLDPLQLFSTGFQMSYSVVVALVIMGVPLGQEWLAAWHPFSFLPRPNWHWYHQWINWSGGWLVAAMAASWAAFLGSTPSGIGYFQLFSPGSLVANLVIIPLSSLAIIGGFLSLLCGLLGLASLSVLFNSAAGVTIIIMDWLVQRGTALPGVYFNARFVEAWMAPTSLIVLTVLLLGGVAGHWSRRYGGYWPPVLFVTLLLFFCVKFG